MRLKHRIEFALVRGGLALGSLFPWSWISATGAALGRIAFHVLRIRRGVVMANLRLALGEQYDERALRRIAGACYAQFGRSYWEYFALPRIRTRGVLERVDYSGLEHLESARAAGKGVLFLAAHFGNWELLALATQALGLPVHLLVGDLANPGVDAAMNDLRRSLGFRVEHRGMGLRAVMKALRAGHAVGVQGDQEARFHGIVVPFFGRESLTHPGSAYLSLATGAPIVPAYLVREGRRFRVIFDAPLWPEGKPGDEAVLALTAAHTARLEAMIRRHPEHWFWLHKRWKRAPRGEDGLPRRAAAAAA
jgi:KDO2-lipid IV(A) lauroyltransferase